MDKSELKDRWIKIYKKPPPIRISRQLLEDHIHYYEQVKIYGGLKPKTVNEVNRMVLSLRSGEDLTHNNHLIIKDGTQPLQITLEHLLNIKTSDWKMQRDIIQNL